MSTKVLADYQVEGAKQGAEIIRQHGFVYLAWAVRTRKTSTSMEMCRLLEAKHVLAITKKKVINGFYSDHFEFKFPFDLEVINYQSVHKIPIKPYDVIIIDEAHSISSVPKPSDWAKKIKELIKQYKCKVIFLSGTPSPESFCQLYHQFWVLPNSPFQEWPSFYKWASATKDDKPLFVVPKKKYIGSMVVNDYSNGIKENILSYVKPYMMSRTQKDSGFVSSIEEEMVTIKASDLTYKLCNRLRKDLVIDSGNDSILADTGAKLMQKLHQMYSGTIILDSGKRLVFDDTKARFIKDKFQGKKIGIFYKFKAEWEAIKQVFGDEVTDDLDEFNSTSKNIALQVQSGREGISLKEADFLVYYNIDFSSVSYIQSRDRMTTMDRKFNKIYWIFTQGGLEEKIYRTVQGKSDYTLAHFKKDFK